MNDVYGIGKQDGIGLGKPTTLAKEGCDLKTLNESWDGKIIPTEPNALSDYLKCVSL